MTVLYAGKNAKKLDPLYTGRNVNGIDTLKNSLVISLETKHATIR